MSRSFVAVGAMIAALLAGSPALANTYHVHVRGGGGPVGVVRGSGVVRGPIGVPGHVYVRGPGRVWVHRPYYGYRTYWNPYWYGYYYPVPVATVAYAETYAAPVGPPPPATVVARRPERDPSIGVGISGTAIRSGTDHPASEGLGALMRFRARPVEVELEVAWDRYGSDTDRTDTRLGGSLYVPIAGRGLQPFLVVGAGMNFAHFGTTGDDLHQGYLNGGGGLALNFSRSFTIAADVRYMVREFFDDASVVEKQPLVLTPGVTPDKRDQAVAFRANAIFYF